MRPARRGLLGDGRAAFGLAVLALAVAAAVFAPLLAADPLVQRDIVATRFLPPLSTDLHGSFHLLGTDRFGRDVWARRSRACTWRSGSTASRSPPSSRAAARPR